MSETINKLKDLSINGKGLFSKEEVIVSIQKAKENSGIVFLLNNKRISASVDNVTNAVRNTVLSKDGESVCLIEHFLATCALLDITDIEVKTNSNELVFEDGSAIHWYECFKNGGYIKSPLKTNQCYHLKEPIFIKSGNKEIVAIPHSGFKASYLMDHPHKALGQMYASYDSNEDSFKILRARTFAGKQENDYFGVSDRLLTLDEDKFNKPLYEPLEPAYHKILDIIGDLMLCGINPLKINMHVIGFKSGHELNVELARKLKEAFKPI